MRAIAHLLLAAILTVLTQIGGILYLLTVLAIRPTRRSFLKRTLAFAGCYLLFTLVFIPQVAPRFGRVPITYSERVRPRSWIYVLANRQYVRPALNALLARAGERLASGESDATIYCLDAGFPFAGLPLLPHLSHGDGRKVDISFAYRTPDGELADRTPSPSGYGVFEPPSASEPDQPATCAARGHDYYGYAHYFTIGPTDHDLRFDAPATRAIARAFLADDAIGKAFLEPHLKQRLRLRDARLRYHGCHSVRHDDHLHIQL